MENQIPQYLLDIIKSPTLYDGIEKIGNAYKLHIDQLEELVSETKMLIIGRTAPEKFLDNVINRLEIEQDLAKKIVEEVNTSVMLPLRKELQGGSQQVAPHHIETPDEILKHIEDGGLELPAPEKSSIPEPQPEPVVPEPAKQAPQQPEPAPTTNLTEHLLQNTIASPHVEETKVEKKYSVDPYREPIM